MQFGLGDGSPCCYPNREALRNQTPESSSLTLPARCPALPETYLARCAVEGSRPIRSPPTARRSRASSAASRRTGPRWTPSVSAPTTSSPTSPASPPIAPPPATVTSVRCAASALGCAPPVTPPTILSAGSATCGCPRRSCRPWRPSRSPGCSRAATPPPPRAAVIGRSSSRCWTPASAVPRWPTWTWGTARGRSASCSCGKGRGPGPHRALRRSLRRDV